MALAYSLGARIWETSITQTTGGTILLDGAQAIVVDGVTHQYRRFRDEFADGAKVALYLTVESSGEFEYSYGTLVYGTPDSIQSRTIVRSDVGVGIPKALGAGTRNALCDIAPEELLARANLLEEIALLGSSQQGTARTNLGAVAGLWTHSVIDHGTTALKMLRLDAAGKLPAVDGSQLTGLSGNPIPAGTKMVFHQAAAPAGWIQDTAVNDRVLRVVSGAGGGTGGSWTVTGLTISNGTLAHTLTTSQIPAHSHAFAGPVNTVFVHLNPTTANSYVAPGAGSGMGEISSGAALANTGGGASHSHGLNTEVFSDGVWRPSYANVIVATRS